MSDILRESFFKEPKFFSGTLFMHDQIRGPDLRLHSAFYSANWRFVPDSRMPWPVRTQAGFSLIVVDPASSAPKFWMPGCKIASWVASEEPPELFGLEGGLPAFFNCDTGENYVDPENQKRVTYHGLKISMLEESLHRAKLALSDLVKLGESYREPTVLRSPAFISAKAMLAELETRP